MNKLNKQILLNAAVTITLLAIVIFVTLCITEPLTKYNKAHKESVQNYNHAVKAWRSNSTLPKPTWECFNLNEQ